MSEHQPHPRVGVIYQFNHAMARVISFDDKIVRWKEIVIGPNNRRQPRLKRTVSETPRWYFDQHASVTLRHLVRRKS